MDELFGNRMFRRRSSGPLFLPAACWIHEQRVVSDGHSHVCEPVRARVFLLGSCSYRPARLGYVSFILVVRPLWEGCLTVGLLDARCVAPCGVTSDLSVDSDTTWNPSHLVVFSQPSASHTANPPAHDTQDASCPSGPAVPRPPPAQTAALPTLHLLVSQVACTQVHALFLRLQGSENWDTQRMEEVRTCGVFLSCRCLCVFFCF